MIFLNSLPFLWILRWYLNRGKDGPRKRVLLFSGASQTVWLSLTKLLFRNLKKFPFDRFLRTAAFVFVGLKVVNWFFVELHLLHISVDYFLWWFFLACSNLLDVIAQSYYSCFDIHYSFFCWIYWMQGECNAVVEKNEYLSVIWPHVSYDIVVKSFVFVVFRQRFLV